MPTFPNATPTAGARPVLTDLERRVLDEVHRRFDAAAPSSVGDVAEALELDVLVASQALAHLGSLGLVGIHQPGTG